MIGNNFDIPVMHQDLANSTMPPLNIPFGTFAPYSTSYLGGVQMKPQPDHDKLILQKEKENQDMSTFKKVLAGVGIIIALGCIAPLRKSITKAGGLKNYLGNKWNSIVNLFKGKQNTAQASQKTGLWQKFKNLFKRKQTS